MEFKKLLEPLKINDKYTMRNRVTSAPMAFALVANIPGVGEKSFRKLEAPARGGDAIVCVGELDVNFKDAVRIPFPPVDFADPDPYTVERIGEYARRIKKHGAIALQELMHAGAEKIPFGEGQEAIGPNDLVHPNGTSVRAMTASDMERIAGDFVTCAKFAKLCGFDGVLLHGGHGFLFSQFLSSTYNKRTDEYGGPLENRARLPIRILEAIREAMGKDFIIELRICGADGLGNGGITPEETGQVLHMLEGVIDLAHVTVGHYYEPVLSGQASSMFHPHGLNARLSEAVKRHTTIPVGLIGGINSPELAEGILEKGQADYIVLGRQSLADPEFVNKVKAGQSDMIKRCVRCYYCFPGSPEEKYTDLPFESTELAQIVGRCSLNPLANLEFDPYELPPAAGKKKVLVAGGGIAGLQAAMTAFDRGHEVVLCEKTERLGGLLYYADVDGDKADLLEFKNVMAREVRSRAIDVRTGTEVKPGLIKELAPDFIIFAMGSEPASAPIPGLEKAVSALEVYKGACKPGKSVIVVGGGLIGAEAGLFLAKAGHDVTVIEALPRVADEAYGMYREALMTELEKESVALLENTKCLEIGEGFVRVQSVQSPGDEEQRLEADTVLYALGMKAVAIEGLVKAAEEAGIPFTIIGDAVSPAKISQATRTGYLSAIGIA